MSDSLLRGWCVAQTEQELVKAQERIDDGTVGTYESRSAELGLDLDTREPPHQPNTRLTHAPVCAFAAVGIPAVHVPVYNDDGQESGAAWRDSGGEALAPCSRMRAATDFANQSLEPEAATTGRLALLLRGDPPNPCAHMRGHMT